MLTLGCIADDITGASDLGLMLAANGMPATLFLGLPDDTREVSTPAVVIALKIRTEPAEHAVRQARAAANWLQDRGVRQLFYKYCSTFDSTAAGNIGPVTDALLELTGSEQTVLLPAFPANGRTVRDGMLLVDGVPLSESPMRNHPLTPMTESSVPALMDAQTAPRQTGSIGLDTVESGAEAIAAALEQQRLAGNRYVCIDAVSDEHLADIAQAITDLDVLTGGSGIGAALPAALRRKGVLDNEAHRYEIPMLEGHAAVIAGSCSEATRRQVAEFAPHATAFRLDPLSLRDDAHAVASLAERAVAASSEGNVLVYSSAEPKTLKQAQAKLGIAESAALIEQTLASIARALWNAGVRKFVIAGGETSGAVASALGTNEFQIAREIDPGVPWLVAERPEPCCLAFKSGNFGRPAFFDHALGLLP